MSDEFGVIEKCHCGDPNSGTGWYEVIHPSATTTHLVYVYEDGSLYFPEGPVMFDHEFHFAAAQGNAHRLIRADAQRHENDCINTRADELESKP